ncbi:cysteine--tRNA ligase [Patescibacteria group bacterium]|nr:cysteine--tRNA ligase [Patescibacteria group bacterium]
MRLYNTLSGQKEELQRPAGRPLKLFVCGPTVYDLSHIGHARTYIFFDVLVRYLRSKNYGVSYIQNITDVDDRIINRAKENREDPLRLSRRFARAYFDDMKALDIVSVDRYAFASRFIGEIVAQVELLLEKGFAYEIAGDGIYFDVTKFPDYGALSHRTAAGAEDGVSRIDESVKKRNKGDFCLWKYPKSAVKAPFYRRTLVTKDGEPVWRTPLGWGRPGWHIEDTAISVKYFGPQYDVHGGAMDLKFPHHEAEIAQAEAAYGKKPFVKVWVHTGFLTVRGEKMSKSLGNFVTIRDFLKDRSANALRYIALATQYRSPIDYSDELAQTAEMAVKGVRSFLLKLAFVEKANRSITGTDESAALIGAADQAFREALDDDLNTPAALGTVFALVNDIQPRVWMLGGENARDIRRFVEEKLALLGFTFPAYREIPIKIMALAEERELSRRNKQFEQADALRKELTALGYSVDDTPIGPFVYRP